MEEDKKKNMISRILKLLALGNEEKNTNVNEREAAKSMAAKLMAEYSLDFVDLKTNSIKNSIFSSSSVEGIDEKVIEWEFLLANDIAKTFDCVVIGENKYNKKEEYMNWQWELLFCGTKNDLDIVVFFFQYLRRTVGKMAEKNYPTNKRKCDSYAMGIVDTLKSRLQDLFQKREEILPSESKALIVLKKDELDNYIKDKFPNVKARKISLKFDEAYSSGKKDGHKINLSRPISNSMPNSTQISV